MDLKLVIRDMLRKGVSKDEIIENLNELGVQDAEKVFEDAVKDYKPPAPAPVPVQAPVAKPVMKAPEPQPAKPVFESKPAAPVAKQPEEKPTSLFNSIGKSLFGGPSPQAKAEAKPSAPVAKPVEAKPVVVEKKPLMPEQKPVEKPAPKIEAPKPAPKPVVQQKEDEELSGIDELIQQEEKNSEPVAEKKPEWQKGPVVVAPVKKTVPVDEDASRIVVEPLVEEKPKKVNANITSIDDSGLEKEMGVAELMEKKEDARPALVKKVSATNIDDIEERLDETVALLKALQDINKRILETDRQVLLRLQK